MLKNEHLLSWIFSFRIILDFCPQFPSEDKIGRTQVKSGRSQFHLLSPALLLHPYSLKTWMHCLSYRFPSCQLFPPCSSIILSGFKWFNSHISVYLLFLTIIYLRASPHSSSFCWILFWQHAGILSFYTQWHISRETKTLKPNTFKPFWWALSSGVSTQMKLPLKQVFTPFGTCPKS